MIDELEHWHLGRGAGIERWEFRPHVEVKSSRKVHSGYADASGFRLHELAVECKRA